MELRVKYLKIRKNLEIHKFPCPMYLDNLVFKEEILKFLKIPKLPVKHTHHGLLEMELKVVYFKVPKNPEIPKIL